jgi:hypothetical protein
MIRTFPSRVTAPKRLVVAALLASVMALAAFAGTAAAASTAVGGISIDTATITVNGGAGGNCTWDVQFTATVVNLTSSPVTVSDVNGASGRVSWSYTGNSGVVTPNVVMTWPGGGVIAGNSSLQTTGDATFTIPCDSTQGDLGIDFTVTDSDQQQTKFSGDAPFLTDGTPLPVFAGLGGLVFAGLLGGILFVRAHRRKTATTS